MRGNKLLRRINNDSAQSLVVAVIVMILCISSAVAILGFTRVAYRNEDSAMKSDKAYYLAQSGQEIARFQLTQNFNYTGTGANDLVIDDGFVSIGVVSAGNQRTVTVIGKAGKVQERIVKKYQRITTSKEALWYDFWYIGLIHEDGDEQFTPRHNWHRYQSILANNDEGTAWVNAIGESFKKIDSNGAIVFEFPTAEPYSSYGVNPLDKSLWVSSFGDKLRSFKTDGTEKSFSPILNVSKRLAVVPSTGSVWVMKDGKLRKYSSNGALEVPEINTSMINDLYMDYINACNDGSVWVYGSNKLARYRSDGFRIFSVDVNPVFSDLVHMRADPVDCSLWVSDYLGKKIHKYNSNGAQIFEIAFPNSQWADDNNYFNVHPQILSDVASDGSIWVLTAGGGNSHINKITRNGEYIKNVCINYVDIPILWGLTRTTLQVPLVTEVF